MNTEQKQKQMLESYKLFIEHCTRSAKSVNNYSDFKRINECISLLNISSYNSLLDIDTPSALELVEEKLNSLPLYKEYNERGNNQYSATIKMYSYFLYALQLSDIHKGSIQKENFVSNVSSSPYRPYITAIKSKPFLLLAGISGTGKSRIWRTSHKGVGKEID